MIKEILKPFFQGLAPSEAHRRITQKLEKSIGTARPFCGQHRVALNFSSTLPKITETSQVTGWPSGLLRRLRSGGFL